MSDRLERNKTTAMAFYDLAFNQGRPAEAAEQYVGATTSFSIASRIGPVTMSTPESTSSDSMKPGRSSSTGMYFRLCRRNRHMTTPCSEG